MDDVRGATCGQATPWSYTFVEPLWLVAFADGHKDAHEEHLIRRIAGLLHVPHQDFIDAKRRARDGNAAGPDGGS